MLAGGRVYVLIRRENAARGERAAAAAALCFCATQSAPISPPAGAERDIGDESCIWGVRGRGGGANECNYREGRGTGVNQAPARTFRFFDVAAARGGA